MHFYCTYFDQGFTRRGLALYESLRKHAGDFKLYALCFDQEAYDALVQYNSGNLIPVSLTELLASDHDLAAVRPYRSTVEFYFTSTPAWPLFLLHKFPEIDQIIYLDADLYFYSSPEPIFEEIKDASISIIGHRYAPHLIDYEKNGIYNVSWVGICRDENGLACLELWREKCLEWCYDRHENGKYADQKYLDYWPERFANLHIIQHLGVNLAPWNISNYKISVDESGRVLVDDQKLIFYHFHGFKKVLKNAYCPNLVQYGSLLTDVIRDNIYLPYIEHLEKLSDYGPLKYRLRGNGLKLWLKKCFLSWRVKIQLFKNQLIVYEVK